MVGTKHCCYGTCTSDSIGTATNLACREIREIPDGLDLHTDDHCFVMAGEWVVLGQINYYSNY